MNPAAAPALPRPAGPGPPVERPVPRSRRIFLPGLPFLAVVVLATFLRFWQLDRIGFNSDEAVYTGTAAALAGNEQLGAVFPIFRAHPVLFQMLLSFFVRGEVSDWSARALPAAIGVATVALTYLLAVRLYGRSVALIGASILAAMLYHVVVSRQVLLDGLMTLCATAVLYCIVRYSETESMRWLAAAGALMGATILAKETSVVLLGAIFAYFALTPTIRLRPRAVAFAVLAMGLVVAAYPLALVISGHVGSGQSYLLWQLFRRSNHPLGFYLSVVPAAVGYVVMLSALGGLIWLRAENGWRERLLMGWLIVPIAFFTIWPVKGYQYLLPTAPVLAVLAGRTIFRLSVTRRFARRGRLSRIVRLLTAGVVVVSVLLPTWITINAEPAGTVLAGTGGVPGGREAGIWLRDNVPDGSQVLTIGPSMANILQFYSHRGARSLSVSSNPQSRNPSYTPVLNPDLAVRSGEFQYLVWDTYTASRTKFFADRLDRLLTHYHGQQVYPRPETSGLDISHRNGPVVVYQVGPS